MKRLLSTFALLLLLISSHALAEERYISDNLFIYMHSGPGANYRIVGSINAGTKITQLKESGGYTQILDNRGRRGWVESKYATSEPSLKIKYPKLESELSQIKASLKSVQQETQSKNQSLIDSLTIRTERVKELENYTNDLNQQLLKSQEETRELRARIDTQKDDLLIRYFTYGGMVAGGGLLLGLILPSVIPRRKKHNNGWA